MGSISVPQLLHHRSRTTLGAYWYFTKLNREHQNLYGLCSTLSTHYLVWSSSIHADSWTTGVDHRRFALPFQRNWWSSAPDVAVFQFSTSSPESLNSLWILPFRWRVVRASIRRHQFSYISLLPTIPCRCGPWHPGTFQWSAPRCLISGLLHLSWQYLCIGRPRCANYWRFLHEFEPCSPPACSA